MQGPCCPQSQEEGSPKHSPLCTPLHGPCNSGGLGPLCSSSCLAHQLAWHSTAGPWLAPGSLPFLSPMPWKYPCGKKSWWPRLLRFGGGFHQPNFSSWAAGSLKLAACLLVIPAPWSHQVLLCTPGKGTRILTTCWGVSPSF